MNAVEATLLELIKDSLFREEINLNFAVDNLQQILVIARKHAVIPLLYKRLRRMPGVPDDLLTTLRSSVISSSIRNLNMTQIQKEIVDALTESGVYCAILKGTSIAAFYPSSEMRELGDIDILVNANQLEEACTVLSREGFSHYSGHEFHESFHGKGCCVEVHQAVSLFPDNEKGRFTSEYMECALTHTHIMSIGEYSFPVLDLPYQLISLLSHMERHMTIVGIGLRQLCDWAVTVNHYQKNIDAGCLAVLDACGLLRFAKIITKTCSQYLCMPEMEWASNVSNTIADAFMNEILSAGNMRNFSLERDFSAVFVTERNEKRRTLLGRYIVNIKYKAMQEYSTIASHKVLLPFFLLFYPCRWWIRSLRGRRDKFNVIHTLTIANKRKNLYDEMRLFL